MLSFFFSSKYILRKIAINIIIYSSSIENKDGRIPLSSCIYKLILTFTTEQIPLVINNRNKSDNKFSIL